MDWLTPNTAPAKSWVTFLRIRHTTRATDRNSPSASGGPAETETELVTAQLVQPRHQIGELLIVQPCHRLVPQQLFADPCSMLANTEQDGKSCCTSSATRAPFRYRDQAVNYLRAITVSLLNSAYE